MIGFLFCYRTASEGTETPYVSIEKKCEDVSGKYFRDCGEWMTSCKANDANASKFWEYAIILVKHDNIETKKHFKSLYPVRIFLTCTFQHFEGF